MMIFDCRLSIFDYWDGTVSSRHLPLFNRQFVA